jgi:hypothetical protein
MQLRPLPGTLSCELSVVQQLLVLLNNLSGARRRANAGGRMREPGSAAQEVHTEGGVVAYKGSGQGRVRKGRTMMRDWLRTFLFTAVLALDTTTISVDKRLLEEVFACFYFLLWLLVLLKLPVARGACRALVRWKREKERKKGVGGRGGGGEGRAASGKLGSDIETVPYPYRSVGRPWGLGCGLDGVPKG